MDVDRVNDLAKHTRAAYEAEIAKEWTKAYDLHEAAMLLWKAFAGTAARFPDMKEKLYKQMGERRAELHKSRLDTLQPFAKQGKPVPEKVPMQPTYSLIRRGLWDEVSPAEMPLSEEATARLLSLTMQELAHPQVISAGLPQYTPTLPTGLPGTPYFIRHHPNFQMSGLRKSVLTLMNGTKTTELLIFEAYSDVEREGTKITEALIYRAGDYPVPAYRVVPHAWSQCSMGAMTLTTTERTLLTAPIDEVPDRVGHEWADRRFCFGGRLFVRKPWKKHRVRLSAEAVYEYTTATPVEGSQSGKKTDDSLPTKLWWRDDAFHIGLNHKYWTAAGLDPVFKEYMFVAELMKAEIALTGATAVPGEEAVRAQQQVSGALGAARLIIGLALALAVGAG